MLLDIYVDAGVLTGRVRVLVEGRFALKRDRRSRPFRELASELGVSIPRCCSLFGKALQRLRMQGEYVQAMNQYLDVMPLPRWVAAVAACFRLGMLAADDEDLVGFEDLASIFGRTQCEEEEEDLLAFEEEECDDWEQEAEDGAS